MDNKSLRRKLDARKSEKQNIQGIFELIEKFVVPFRADFYGTKTMEGSIDWRRRELYDSTAVLANQNLAANIHSTVTNPLIPWAQFKFRQKELNESQEAKAWLETCEEIEFQAIQESNFNLEANEIYTDLTSMGTGNMIEEPLEDGAGNLEELEFTTVPTDECYFDPDHKGRAINFYRSLMWTPIQIIDKFGIENVPEHIVDKLESDAEIEKIEVVFCIYKRQVVGPANPFETVAPEAREYGWRYFLYDTCESLGEEGGYYEMPAFIPRWRKTSGSQWGNSPAMVALSDILTLNQLVEMTLKAGEKAIDPSILATRRGVFGDVNLGPGEVTLVADMNSMAAFESKARFDVGKMQKVDLQASIERTFFIDQLQLKQSPAMTATEVRARMQLMQRLLGPTLGRLQSDFLDPVITRTFRILFRYGMFPEPPAIVIDSAASLDVEYLGPLAMSQKMEQVGATRAWVAGVMEISAVFENAKDNVNIDETVRDLGLASGVPAKNLRSKAEVEKIRMERNQQRAREQEIAMAQGTGQAMESIGKGRAAMSGEPQQQGVAG